MRSAPGCLTHLLAAISSVAYPFNALAGQHASCPSGFEYIGTLQGDTSGLEVKIWQQLRLPDGFNLDTSYQQASPSGSGNGARSTLPNELIPAGIHIMPGGVATGGWAVSNPVMVDARTFQMYLYCSMDQGALNFIHWGCSVWVDVCAKSE
jgi:hypothetical protein